MTVITIVVVALVLGIGMLLFQDGGIGQQWIENMFNNQINNVAPTPGP